LGKAIAGVAISTGEAIASFAKKSHIPLDRVLLVVLRPGLNKGWGLDGIVEFSSASTPSV
jgi:hypothetical protein